MSAWSGYEPFGSLLPGRNYSSGSYRFGFNGQEKDNEVYGSEGTSYTAEFWQYDPRAGRRWNLDPVTNAGVSGYHGLMNNPVWMKDPSGANAIDYKDENGKLLGSDGTTMKGTRTMTGKQWESIRGNKNFFENGQFNARGRAELYVKSNPFEASPSSGGFGGSGKGPDVSLTIENRESDEFSNFFFEGKVTRFDNITYGSGFANLTLAQEKTDGSTSIEAGGTLGLGPVEFSGSTSNQLDVSGMVAVTARNKTVGLGTSQQDGLLLSWSATTDTRSVNGGIARVGTTIATKPSPQLVGVGVIVLMVSQPELWPAIPPIARGIIMR